MSSDEHRDEISEKGEKYSADGDRSGSMSRPKRMRGSIASTAADRARRNVNMKINNPLDEYTESELRIMGSDYAKMHGMVDAEDIRAFELGAVLAQEPQQFERIRDHTSPQEMTVLEKEYASRWSQPKILYLVIVLCSTCAAVQGMGESRSIQSHTTISNLNLDETVVNGAQLFYTVQFGIGGKDQRSTWLTGLCNSAPYLCCAFVGCWLTEPYNYYFGRRGTIFITCLFSALACLWQGFVNTWWHMFIARFALGLGIGPKSATVPIYAAEATPPAIRGALVMQWQVGYYVHQLISLILTSIIDVDRIRHHGRICC